MTDWRKRKSIELEIFLEDMAEEGEHFLYRDRPVEFIRPIGGDYVRVRDVGTNAKHIVKIDFLEPIDPLSLLAYMVDDNPGAEPPPELELDEPQELADLV